MKRLLLGVALAIQCVVGTLALGQHRVEPASRTHEDGFLAWAAEKVPRGAAVLLVGGDEPEFFQASSELYPRTVIWLAPRERWGTPVPAGPVEWRRLVERTSARYVLLEGADPSALPGAGEVATFDALRGEHLATLR